MITKMISGQIIARNFLSTIGKCSVTKWLIVILTFAIITECDDADSGWWIEWQVSTGNAYYSNLTYQFEISYNGRHDSWNGATIDSGYIYQFIHMWGAISTVNSSIRPNVSFRLTKNDTTLIGLVRKIRGLILEAVVLPAYDTRRI